MIARSRGRRRRSTYDGARPLRVAFVGHSAAMSGAEISLIRLLGALEDIDSIVLLAEDGPLVGKLLDMGIDVRVMPLPRVAANVRRSDVTARKIPASAVVAAAVYTWRLIRVLRRLAPDLVHTNSLKAHFYGGVAARIAGTPHVWHARDRATAEYLPKSTVRLVRAAARVLPVMVVANSQCTLRSYPKVRAGTVVYNGVPEHMRSRPALPPVPPLRIGIVGRLAPWKGQDIFLRAFASAFSGGGERAVLIGGALFDDHGFEAQLHSLSEELGITDQVEFVGFTDRVADELDSLHIMVHCSTIPEPFGQVVVEGMAAGLPVVAADACGPSEIIENGLTGVLVPCGDVEALTKALHRLAQDEALRERLGRAAKTASARFSPQRCGAQMMTVYRAVLSSLDHRVDNGRTPIGQASQRDPDTAAVSSRR